MADRVFPSSVSLHQQLKRETADLHRRLEADVGLLEPGLSLERYRRVLQTFLGFYAPIETGLAERAELAIDLPLRARAELIERDLVSLGLSRRELDDVPRCTDLPPLSCLEDLAGCVYVLEGACLGGQVIARALHRRLGVAKDSGASFFIGDAEGTSARWRLVLGWLEGLVHTGARAGTIVASARATFLSFARWVELQTGSARTVGRDHGRSDRL
jgi:heme oxygenase (biliverdin-IX-beta and delta-forming)